MAAVTICSDFPVLAFWKQTFESIVFVKSLILFLLNKNLWVIIYISDLSTLFRSLINLFLSIYIESILTCYQSDSRQIRPIILPSTPTSIKALHWPVIPFKQCPDASALFFSNVVCVCFSDLLSWCTTLNPPVSIQLFTTHWCTIFILQVLTEHKLYISHWAKLRESLSKEGKGGPHSWSLGSIFKRVNTTV